MKYLEIDGVRVSAIGLGTWQFGSREWGYGAEYAAHQAPALVRRALELGVTLIDTAEVIGTEWPITEDHQDMPVLRAAFARRLVGRLTAADTKIGGE